MARTGFRTLVLLASATAAGAFGKPRAQPAATRRPSRTRLHLASPLARADAAVAAAADRAPFTDEELDLALRSLRNLAPKAAVSCAGKAAGVGVSGQSFDWPALRELLAASAHTAPKDWARVEATARELGAILGDPGDAPFRHVFKRVLRDGGWEGAELAAAGRATKPWVVLVTGLNGIRKTTSIYQPWFKAVLHEALGAQADAPAADKDGGLEALDEAELPGGADSFFRQLDYMIATLANEDFRALYADTAGDVALYARVKESIFARYRTYAEALGALLVRATRARRMNVMVETSGRDAGMYAYVDAFFPDAEYRKLVVNFAINELGFAERSVDARMTREMAAGEAALAGGDPVVLVEANAGGPYGSAVLAGVQAESRAVWARVLAGEEGGVGASWLKASIAIDAHETEPWTASAVLPDGTRSDREYSFT